jgi:hypothetical protein
MTVDTDSLRVVLPRPGLTRVAREGTIGDVPDSVAFFLQLNYGLSRPLHSSLVQCPPAIPGSVTQMTWMAALTSISGCHSGTLQNKRVTHLRITRPDPVVISCEVLGCVSRCDLGGNYPRIDFQPPTAMM